MALVATVQPVLTFQESFCGLSTPLSTCAVPVLRPAYMSLPRARPPAVCNMLGAAPDKLADERVPWPAFQAAPAQQGWGVGAHAAGACWKGWCPTYVLVLGHAELEGAESGRCPRAKVGLAAGQVRVRAGLPASRAAGVCPAALWRGVSPSFSITYPPHKCVDAVEPISQLKECWSGVGGFVATMHQRKEDSETERQDA